MAQIGEVPGGGRPFGDIYNVSTPALDRFGQQMQQKEVQRQQQLRQDSKMLDDEFSRNMTNIRDADIPEYSKAYGDYKMAYQQSLKQKDQLTPEQQMELMRKKANVYSVLNKSKETNDILKDYAKKTLDNKNGIFEEDAPQRLRNIMQLPSSQITDKHYNDLMYKFGTTDFTKQEKYAKGDIKPIGLDNLGKDPNNPTNDLVATYNVGNNFLQHYDALNKSIVGAKERGDYQRLINNSYTPEQEQQLTQAFLQKVNDPLYQKLYGINGTITFPSESYNTPDGRAFRLATMKSVVDAPLVPVTKSVPNKERTDAANLILSNKKSDYRHKLGMQSIAANKANAAAKGTEIEDVYSGIKSITDAAEKNGTYAQMNVLDASAQKALLDYANSIAKAKDIFGKDADLTQENTLLKNVNGVPTLFLIQQKGSQADYIKGKGIRAILPLNSFDINSKINTTAKQKQVLIKQGNTNAAPKNSGSQKTYNVNGKPYTQSQIEKGAAHYNLTVDEYLKQLGVQ